MRRKQIDWSAFQTLVQANNAATVALSYEVWPDWAKGARDPKVDHLLMWPFEGAQKGKTYDIGAADARLTVIRYDEKDVSAGFPYNKDVYVYVCASNDTVWQYGPFSKGEPHHWMASIYSEYKGWPLIGEPDLVGDD